jgi:dihydroorotate dehydrogenase electron transfer subunit
MRFAWPWEAPMPGQFLTIRSGDGADPLLRRPFAFSAYDEGAREAAIVFLERGRGTAALARYAPGRELDVLGPLGRGFPIDEATTNGEPVAACGGGIGVGPILFLADALAARGARCLPVFGFRNAASVPRLRWPEGSIIATDDGSFGFRGTVTDALKARLGEIGKVRVMACGPAPMLASLARVSEGERLRYDASVEEWMACAVGACAGCAVPLLGGGFLKACSDGPVLDGNAIDWGNA